MQKERLRNLRTLKATPAIISRASKDLPVYEKCKRWYDSGTYTAIKSLHRYAYYLRLQYLQGIIKVAVFTPWMIQQGESYPAFEIFLNTDGQEYITRYYDSDGTEKWSTATIGYLAYILDGKNTDRILGKYKTGFYDYCGRCDKAAWINPEGNKTLKRTLKTTSCGFGAIQDFQEQCKKVKRDRNDAKTFKPWDDDMKLVPNLPQRFIDWAFRENTEHYIFYDAGTKKGYCSRCNKVVPISGQKHKRQGKCPSCKKPIVYIANGKRSKYLSTPVATSSIVQPIKGGLCIQTIYTQRSYYNQKDFRKPTLRCEIMFKTIIQNNSVRTYTEGWYKQRVLRWVPCYYGGNTGRMYKGNAHKIKEMYPYSAAYIILAKELNIPLVTYLDREKRYPVYESLMKIGLYKIVADSLHSSYIPESYNHREAAKALELDNARLKKLIALGGSVVTLEWLKLEKRMNTEFKAEMIRYFSDNDIMEYRMSFIDKKMSYEKIWHYLDKQHSLTGESPDQLLTTWRDYLNMAEKNKVNIGLEQNYKPANVKKAHAAMIELANRAEIAKEAKPIRSRYKKLEKNLTELTRYEYSADGYSIVAPKKIEDIILEGRVLGHCIHRCDYYFDRINTKESFILFLRKTSSQDTPWYTLEVEPGGNIRQKRTTGDNQNADLDLALPFLKKWQHHIKKIMSAEDKKLAAIADSKRKANYKNIRENKKIVWHGKHQGELLADVLEKDFMAAI